MSFGRRLRRRAERAAQNKGARGVPDDLIAAGMDRCPDCGATGRKRVACDEADRIAAAHGFGAHPQQFAQLEHEHWHCAACGLVGLSLSPEATDALDPDE